MKTFWYSIVVIAVIVVLVIAFKQYPGKGGIKETGSSNTENGQLCYIWNTEAGDKAQLSLDVRGANVTGELNWLPAQKDKKTGTFEGTIGTADATATRTVNATWNTMAEGMSAKEELKILVRDNIANVGFGAMKDNGKGVFVYSDPSKLSWEPNLQRTDCGDSAMD